MHACVCLSTTSVAVAVTLHRTSFLRGWENIIVATLKGNSHRIHTEKKTRATTHEHIFLSHYLQWFPVPSRNPSSVQPLNHLSFCWLYPFFKTSKSLLPIYFNKACLRRCQIDSSRSQCERIVARSGERRQGGGGMKAPAEWRSDTMLHSSRSRETGRCC